jgi:hypothetical protein
MPIAAVLLQEKGQIENQIRASARSRDQARLGLLRNVEFHARDRREKGACCRYLLGSMPTRAEHFGVIALRELGGKQ